MAIKDKIAGMDEQELRQLEENAKRALAGSNAAKGKEAEDVLTAIASERDRRQREERERRRVALSQVREEVKDKPLFERVLLAFERIPPKDWEVEALRALAANPGADFTVLAKATGRQEGGYINLAVGTLCSEREHYLGQAPQSVARKGEKNYSSLLVDFTEHREADGSRWHGWQLKPEAEAALRHLGILGPG